MNFSQESASKARVDLEDAALLLDTSIPNREERNAVKCKLLQVAAFLELCEKNLRSEAQIAPADSPRSLTTRELFTLYGCEAYWKEEYVGMRHQDIRTDLMRIRVLTKLSKLKHALLRLS